MQMEDEEKEYAGDYLISGMLGDGGQARVFEGIRDMRSFALKVYFEGESRREAFLLERDFLANLQHKNLINMVDSCMEAAVKLSKEPVVTLPLLVLELADGMELFDYIAKTGPFPPDICRYFFKELISAIHYLHHRGVTHRDLKPQNILFNRDYVLKVSDFGLSRDAKGDHGDYRLRSLVGTEGYRPPEMEQRQYEGLQADLFAAGVILFIMLKGSPPFLNTTSSDKIYKLIREGSFAKFWAMHEKNRPKLFTDSFKRLIISFFSPNVAARPSFESLACDEWLSGETAMEEKVQEYMGAMHMKILNGDEKRKQMWIHRNNLLKNMLNGDDDCPGTRRENGEDTSTLDLSLEGLPTTRKSHIAYNFDSISYILHWTESVLKEEEEAQSEKYYNDQSTLKLTNFKIDFNHKDFILNLDLTYLLNCEEQANLKIKGSLYRKNNKVGILWENQEGDRFLFANIKNSFQTAIPSS